jgi:protein phosphatase
MPFEIGAVTDVGRRRSGNEDAWDVLEIPSGLLCVVADGMGGHLAGEVASQLTVQTLRQVFTDEEAAAESSRSLEAAIQQANRAIHQAAIADPAKQGMGTTVVCALLRDGTAQLANVGDSPAFLVRGGQAERLTQDHSWVAEEIARGALTAEEAEGHPYRHILTRSLGLDEQVEVQLYEPVSLRDGDVLVLSSDGLSEHLRPEDLARVVADGPAAEIAQALVDLANRRGGSDNITVIVARWSRGAA